MGELLRRSKESLEAAQLLFQENHFDFSASRSYYAMFYAAQAILLTKGISTSTHKGLITTLAIEFVKTNILPKKIFDYLRQALEARQIGDYGVLQHVSREEAERLLKEAMEFITVVEKYLENKQE